MTKYCRLCGRPMAGTWMELSEKEAASGEAREMPLETDCVEDCWGCLREIEQGIPDPRPPASSQATKSDDRIDQQKHIADVDRTKSDNIPQRLVEPERHGATPIRPFPSYSTGIRSPLETAPNLLEYIGDIRQMTERARVAEPSTPTGTYTTDVDTLEYALARTAFLSSLNKDCVTFGVQRSLRDTFAHVIDMVVGVVTELLGSRPRIQTLSRSLAFLQIDRAVFIKIEDYSSTARDMWSVADRNIYVSGYGDEKQIKALRQKLEEIANQDFRVPKIIWHYIASHGQRSTTTIQFGQPKPVHNAYYPWITSGVSDYYDRFMQSEENILVLLGETGTGKTSFIRNLIWYSRWDAAFTYDEKLLSADDMFVEFLTNDVELMVVEDADLFLTNREHDGNKMMARFLNISDGLFKSDRTKKIIFTANLTQPTRIDNALLREGRCFDCMMFRPLSWDEATRAAAVAAISPPADRGRDYTLAQLFATRRRAVHPFGFS